MQNTKVKQYKPNAHVLKVKHSFGWRFYSVDYPKAYAERVRGQGKEVEYVGQTDENGYIKW